MNEVLLGDCLELMKSIPDKSIDMCLTSPPYDNLRTYGTSKLEWDFEGIAKELFRVIKDGGVLVWVVGDATINGSETGTSFKQALYFKDIGFNLHDTMIYQKNSYPFPPVNRYYQQFEYMFVLSKGNPLTYNIQRQPTNPLWKNNNHKSASQRNKDGTTTKLKGECGKDTRKMDNVWLLNTGYMRSTADKIAYKHPAIFPDELAKRHILSWSNEGDVVLDCFAGSGTTAIACLNTKRNYILMEKEPKYYEIILERIKNHTVQGKLE